MNNSPSVALPAPVAQRLMAAAVIAWAGRRTVSMDTKRALDAALANSNPVARHLVADANGVDQLARLWLSAWRRHHVVYRVAGPRSPANLIARTQLHLREAREQGALWVALPDKTYPGVPLQRDWPYGYGSGTWAGLSVALAHAMPALLYLPPWAENAVPQDWPLTPAGSGWYVGRAETQDLR